METVILVIIGTILNLIAAFSPLYIIVSCIGIFKKKITTFEIVTTIFCFPLSIFYWGTYFSSTFTFPLWFEIAAGIGLILMIIELIRNKKEKFIKR